MKTKRIPELSFRVPDTAEGRFWIDQAREYVNRERHREVSARITGTGHEAYFRIYLHESKGWKKQHGATIENTLKAGLRRAQAEYLAHKAVLGHRDHEISKLETAWTNVGAEKDVALKELNRWRVGCLSCAAMVVFLAVLVVH